jgi:hypothetical protein
MVEMQDSTVEEGEVVKVRALPEATASLSLLTSPTHPPVHAECACVAVCGCRVEYAS